MLLIEVAQGLVASSRENRRVASLGDPALQQSRELRLVFDNQNAFVHAVSPLSNGSVKLTRVPQSASGRSPTQSLPPRAILAERGDGVLVLLDLGSAWLSVEVAL